MVQDRRQDGTASRNITEQLPARRHVVFSARPVITAAACCLGMSLLGAADQAAHSATHTTNLMRPLHPHCTRHAGLKPRAAATSEGHDPPKRRLLPSAILVVG